MLLPSLLQAAHLLVGSGLALFSVWWRFSPE
jgi:hypothetical protein